MAKQATIPETEPDGQYEEEAPPKRSKMDPEAAAINCIARQMAELPDAEARARVMSMAWDRWGPKPAGRLFAPEQIYTPQELQRMGTSCTAPPGPGGAGGA